MTEAFTNIQGIGKILVLSAGIMQPDEVNPVVVQVIREKGIRHSPNTPEQITIQMVKEADTIIGKDAALKDSGQRPYSKVTNWNIEDPSALEVQHSRRTKCQNDVLGRLMASCMNLT